MTFHTRFCTALSRIALSSPWTLSFLFIHNHSQLSSHSPLGGEAVGGEPVGDPSSPEQSSGGSVLHEFSIDNVGGFINNEPPDIAITYRS